MRYTYRASLHNLLQRKIHPRIACDQVPIERLSILKLDEHWVALRRRQEAEW